MTKQNKMYALAGGVVGIVLLASLPTLLKPGRPSAPVTPQWETDAYHARIKAQVEEKIRIQEQKNLEKDKETERNLEEMERKWAEDRRLANEALEREERARWEAFNKKWGR